MVSMFIDVTRRKDGVWETTTCREVFDCVLEETWERIHSLYDVYSKDMYSREQRYAVSSKIGESDIRVYSDCYDTLKTLIRSNKSYNDFSVDELKFIMKYLKRVDPQFQTDCLAAYKNNTYWNDRYSLTDEELLNGATYQLIRNMTSNAVTYTMTHMGKSDVLRMNDTGCVTWEDWTSFLQTRPGFNDWCDQILGREERTIKVRIPSSADGYYYTSNLIFDKH